MDGEVALRLRWAGLLVACLTFVVLPPTARAQVPTSPGRLIDVNGYRTRVQTLGLDRREEGTPVLVLFAGAGSRLTSWGGWIEDVAELAPVVTYERPGIGRSVENGGDASPPLMAEHARAVLDALAVAPPYVLVGHSWGGVLIQFFAARYPDEVVGMVYLDPTDAMESQCEAVMASSEEECALRQADIAPQASSGAQARTASEPEAIRAWRETPVEARGVPEAPDVPTAVLLSMQPPPVGAGGPPWLNEAFFEAHLERRVSRFSERVQRLSHGTLLVATDAGHFVQLEAPELATEAVRRVLAEVRRR